MKAIVHYIKHWDNDTKGSVSGDFRNLSHALELTTANLISEALEDGASKNAYPSELFTITKAEIVADIPAWTGVPVAAF